MLRGLELLKPACAFRARSRSTGLAQYPRPPAATAQRPAVVRRARVPPRGPTAWMHLAHLALGVGAARLLEHGVLRPRWRHGFAALAFAPTGHDEGGRRRLARHGGSERGHLPVKFQ